MTKIVGSDQLLGLISQNLAKARRSDRLTSTSRLSQKSRKKEIGESSASVAKINEEVDSDIFEIVANRLSEISLDDPLRSSKAFRLFLEAILINEFGIGVANDPSFSNLIDQVQKTMEQDIVLAGFINRGMSDLLQDR